MHVLCRLGSAAIERPAATSNEACRGRPACWHSRAEGFGLVISRVASSGDHAARSKRGAEVGAL